MLPSASLLSMYIILVTASSFSPFSVGGCVSTDSSSLVSGEEGATGSVFSAGVQPMSKPTNAQVQMIFFMRNFRYLASKIWF